MGRPLRPRTRARAHLLDRLAILVALVVSGTGVAADPPDAEPAPANANATPPPPEDVETIVVTASRRETPLERVGASVTVLDGDDLERSESRDLLETLADVPGVTVVQTGSRGGVTSLFVRGGESDHNLVLVDGIEVNRGGGAFDFANLTIDGVERVEIVRGPLSGLYGSDALSSAIHVITRRGEGPRRGALAFSGGSHGTFEETLSVSEGFDRFGYAVSLGRYDTEGLERRNNGVWNTSARLRADWAPSDALHLGATTWYTESAFDVPFDFVPGVRSGFAPVDPDQGRRTRELVVGVDGSFEAAAWWTHRLRVGLASARERSFDGLDAIPSDSSERETVSRERRLVADYGQVLRFPAFGRADAVLTWGIELEKEWFRQRTEAQTPGASPSKSRARASRETLGAYGQLELGVAEQLFLAAGVRLDENSEFGSFTSPFASAVWRIPGTRTRLRASLRRGFRQPAFSENFGSAFVAGNSDLDPERAFSFELGVDQTLFDGRLRLYATGFETRYSDLITFTGGLGSGATFENVQSTEAKGIEAGFEMRIGAGVRAGAWYTRLETTVTDAGGSANSAFVEGESLLRRPGHAGAFFVEYASERFDARLSGTVVGSRIDRDFGVFPERRVRNPGYVKVDLRLSRQVFRHAGSGSALRLVGVVENLLDEDYEEAFGFRAPGIEARGGFELRF